MPDDACPFCGAPFNAPGLDPTRVEFTGINRSPMFAMHGKCAWRLKRQIPTEKDLRALYSDAQRSIFWQR